MPPEVVLAIFRRYGRPLEVRMPAPEPDDRRHELSGSRVRVLQVMGYGDVIPNDYFVLEPAEGEPVAVPGPLFSAALEALVRAAKLQP